MAFLQWFFLPALAAIGANVKRPTQAITAAEVSRWATSDQLDYPVGIADLAMSSLQKHGYVESRALKPQRSRSPRLWFATATGLQVAQAAVQAMPGATPDLQALPTRVWNLLRIRRRLTAVEAAETLIDADDNFEAQTKRIGALLLAWTKHPTSAVVTAQKREAGGRVRYVLVKDLGRWPPPTKPGQIHPSQLPNASAVPARYRKASPAVASDSEGCLDQ